MSVDVIDIGLALRRVPDDDEDEIPDWVSGLPSLDPAELSEPRESASGEPQEEDEEIPEWLTDIRQKTSEDTKQPEEVLPAFGIDPDELYLARHKHRQISGRQGH